MPNEIKDYFSSASALTITLASLGSGSGRQSTLIDNTSDRWQDLLIYVKITNGTSPNNYSTVEVYLIRCDAAPGSATHFDDGCGASDAAYPSTVLPPNAELLGVLHNDATAATGDVVQGTFKANAPGPGWGIGIFNQTGVALNATAGNHYVRWVGRNPQVQ